jgi:transcriptional regulator with AAA-type ATPase domain
MERILRIVASFARDNYRCMLLGPSGSGKEYMAYYYAKKGIESGTLNPNGAFQAINCATLAGSLGLDQLVGHVEGAFTGADSTKDGAFQTCQGGILFLDEVADLPKEVEAILLTALDPSNGFVQKLGSLERDATTSVIVLAATNRPLDKMRGDLLARLKHDVTIPSLNERVEEIAPAMERFLKNALAIRHRTETADWFSDMDAGQIEALARKIANALKVFAKRHHWKNSFRTLNEVAEYAVCISRADTREQLIEETMTEFKTRADQISPPPAGTAAAAPRDDALRPAGDAKARLRREVADAFKTNVRIDKQELDDLADFIAGKGDKAFKRNDATQAISGRTPSPGTMLNRLRRLVEVGVLVVEDAAAGLYKLADRQQLNIQLGQLARARRLIPEKPRHELEPSQKEDLKRVGQMLKVRSSIYISAEVGTGKTTFARAFAEKHSKDHSILMWSFLETPKHPGGMPGFLTTLHEALRALGAEGLEAPDGANADSLTSWVEAAGEHLALLGGEDRKTLLVLDDIDRIMGQRDAMDVLETMLSKWHTCKLLLLGAKRPNFPSLGADAVPLEYTLRGLSD